MGFRMPRAETMEARKEQEIRDVLPLYALCLVDADEALAVEEHLLAGCADCARELLELREVAGQIPYAFRSVTPPATIRR